MHVAWMAVMLCTFKILRALLLRCVSFIIGPGFIEVQILKK